MHHLAAVLHTLGVRLSDTAARRTNERGSVTIDAGAMQKLRDEGKSLLPIGVVEVNGEFARGDVIAVRSTGGSEVARGLSNYSSAETRLIARRPSSQIAAALGYAGETELIHRDNLVLSA